MEFAGPSRRPVGLLFPFWLPIEAGKTANAVCGYVLSSDFSEYVLNFFFVYISSHDLHTCFLYSRLSSDDLENICLISMVGWMCGTMLLTKKMGRADTSDLSTSTDVTHAFRHQLCAGVGKGFASPNVGFQATHITTKKPVSSSIGLRRMCFPPSPPLCTRPFLPISTYSSWSTSTCVSRAGCDSEIY